MLGRKPGGNPSSWRVKWGSQGVKFRPKHARTSTTTGRTKSLRATEDRAADGGQARQGVAALLAQTAEEGEAMRQMCSPRKQTPKGWIPSQVEL